MYRLLKRLQIYVLVAKIPRCRELLQEISMNKEMMICAGSINRDHVHKLISISPQPLEHLTGKSLHRLLSEYKALRKWYWGHRLARGYWVASSGNVADEVWKEYIKNAESPPPGDDFTAV